MINQLFPEDPKDDAPIPLKSVENIQKKSNVLQKIETKDKEDSKKQIQQQKKSKYEVIDGVSKPTSPFFLFFDNFRELESKKEVKYEGNLRKHAGEIWRQLPEQERKVWSKKFNDMKDAYFNKKKQLENKENTIWSLTSWNDIKPDLDNLPEVNFDTLEDEDGYGAGNFYEEYSADINSKSCINTLLTDIPI